VAGGSRSLLIVGLGEFAAHMDKINEWYQSFHLLELPIPPEPEEDEEENSEEASGNSRNPAPGLM